MAAHMLAGSGAQNGKYTLNYSDTTLMTCNANGYSIVCTDVSHGKKGIIGGCQRVNATMNIGSSKCSRVSWG